MPENPYHGKITNAGSQVLPAIHNQPSTAKPQKITGTDLRAGKK